ncbi:ABC transporter ATP-binding protein [Candidatus Methylacidithermus pantelleriae]|uniref:Intermembrane phospholipid transport system, ATP binding subunit MlaF n=1 Tax=Candidatus Methylacidithermus pantelleriae TaxID=2744239 RepID=A0A8J2BJM0_9BACT|nr:ATP-binding cassette domain-containing protein [Candidatus Methylacidithermus pantelleriae]CAF0693018.1 intermembrane phospholipid transport system, ATP binding subunit MlaF [Candidatus Methylacidithermus pantelleriae]
MVRLIGVRKSFGRQPVLRGVDLEVEAGERLVIIGRSGGGKSVLLKLILGLIKPDAGQIWHGETEISILSEERLMPLRKTMGMVFQNGALFDSMTVGENVAFPLQEHTRLPRAEIWRMVREALEQVGLAGQEHKMPEELSGGMRKRAALARAIIARPQLILYDEPTAGLDPIAADSIDRLICCLNRKYGMTSIVVTHDIPSAFRIGDRIAFLYEGTIRCVLPPEKIRSHPDPELRRFIEGISEEEELG